MEVEPDGFRQATFIPDHRRQPACSSVAIRVTAGRPRLRKATRRRRQFRPFMRLAYTGNWARMASPRYGSPVRSPGAGGPDVCGIERRPAWWS